MKTFTAIVTIGLASVAMASSGNAFQGRAAAAPSAKASSTTQAALPTTILHMVSSGGIAEAGWSDELSTHALSVIVDSSGTTSSAIFSYHAIAFDPTSQVCTDDPVLGTFCLFTRIILDLVEAFISADDVTITATTARLNTDLARASALFFSHCVVDDIAGTTDCTDVPASGLINLEWQRTSANFSRDRSATETKTGPVIRRVTGSSTTFTANLTGSVLGTAVPKQNVVAAMGTTKSLSIDILRTQ